MNMKNKIINIIASLVFLLSLNTNSFAQNETYSIEYEYHKVGVFNPEWEIYNSLNPKKFEHITGYYREEMAKTIIKAVQSKKVKIYDIRKREISIDSVIKSVIEFEQKNFSHNLSKDSVFKFLVPYISAYQFEEFVNYNYKTLSLEKRIKAYCPTMVRYKSFNEAKADSLHLPLFWLFPDDIVPTPNSNNNLSAKHSVNTGDFNIPDTVISLQELKYPVQNPYTLSIFDKAKKRDASILRYDGSKFKAPKEIDDLFIIKNTIIIENDEGVEEKKVVSSDILPEDIKHIRIGETWSIDPNTLLIKKQVKYIIPLIESDKGFQQLGIRIQ